MYQMMNVGKLAFGGIYDAYENVNDTYQFIGESNCPRALRADIWLPIILKIPSRIAHYVNIIVMRLFSIIIIT